MNVLAIADAYPMPDGNSGDFLFFNLIGMTRQKHNVFFVAFGVNLKAQEFGNDLMAGYWEVLAEAEPKVKFRIVENMPTEELM